jgi:hypothetical protein
MPTSMPEQVRIEYYHVLGGFVERYGFIDSLVADMCMVLFEHLGGHPDFVSASQRFSKRREFILKCYAQNAELAADEGALKNIFQTVDGVDGYRHYLVHGCRTGFFPETQSYRFSRVDARDDRKGYEQVSITVSHDVLVQVTQAGAEVVKGLIPIGKRLRKLAGLQETTQ